MTVPAVPSVGNGEGGGPPTTPPPSPVSVELLTTSVVIPYVTGMLMLGTEEAVEFEAPMSLRVSLNGDRDDAYAQMLATVLAGTTRIIIVEQDVVPPEGSLAALAACPLPWCYHSYPVPGHHDGPMLGLTKFDASIGQAHPGWAKRALWYRKGKRAWCHWRSANECLERELVSLGYEAHRHHPDAVHLHDYDDE